MSLINHPKKRVLIQKGFRAFEAEDYSGAMRFFSDALRLDEEDLEAKIGLLLSDMISDFPKEAQGFYELYKAMILNNPRAMRKKIQQGILDSIQSFDNGIEKISAVLCEDNNQKIDEMDGILYSDFKAMCLETNFKEVFENLIFSTKIIFTKKEDFYDFLEVLLENNFVDFCLQYIENMKEAMYYDLRIKDILQRAVQKL
ncbi:MULTISPECIES: histidine kinase [unclassified Helicobacter]|uniref:histidine kinase n=1 Tax=unclassified Helicobacter TaxID=2593540 RepID=UPI000CF0CA36|nr:MULTISPECIES: histidine kinase [unclassified Helicobacter]